MGRATKRRFGAGALACGILAAVALTADGQVEPATYGEVVERRGYREVAVTFVSAGERFGGVIYLPPEPGVYPASVFVHGSGRSPRLRFNSMWASEFVERGMAVLTYDKRGVGESGGECCPQIMPQLAGDAMAAAAAAREYPEIDADRVGLHGVSQAGWIIPNAAARDPRIKFTVVISGPTISVGQEIAYSHLTDERNCGERGMPIAAAERRVANMPPRGHDPQDDLRAMTQPGIWVFGLNDISVPINLSIAYLEELVAAGKPYSVIAVRGANHGMGLGACRGGRTAPGWIEPMFEWLAANS